MPASVGEIMSKSKGHHILFPRVIHNSQEPSRLLRSNTWLIPPLERLTHDALHKAIKIVPILDYDNSQRILNSFAPAPGNYIRTIDNLLLTMNEVFSHPKASDIERGLGQLAMYTIEQQKPFIREGLIQSQARLTLIEGGAIVPDIAA